MHKASQEGIFAIKNFAIKVSDRVFNKVEFLMHNVKFHQKFEYSSRCMSHLSFAKFASLTHHIPNEDSVYSSSSQPDASSLGHGKI